MMEELSLESIEEQLKGQYLNLYQTILLRFQEKKEVFAVLPRTIQRSVLGDLEKIMISLEASPEYKRQLSHDEFDKYISMVRELHTKMSDSDIAKRVGVSRPTILRLRRGVLTKNQRPEILQSLERLYNVNFPDGYKDDTVDDQCVVKEHDS